MCVRRNISYGGSLYRLFEANAGLVMFEASEIGPEGFKHCLSFHLDWYVWPALKDRCATAKAVCYAQHYPLFADIDAGIGRGYPNDRI